MKKKLLLILLALALAFSMFACTGDGDPEKCAKCVDNDGDGFCDKCDELVAKHRCKDKDKDGECDECGKSVACKTCVDVDPRDAICDVCGNDVICEEHVNENEDRRCDVCGNNIVVCDTCVDTNKNAKCDVCGKKVACKTCVDVNPKDAKCDVCGEAVPCATHVNANEDAKCDVCKTIIPVCDECVDANDSGKCDICGKTYNADTHTCIDVNPKDASCDICGGAVACTTHTNANEDRACDVCGMTIPVCQSCVDANDNKKCDVCGSIVPCDECVDADPKDAICDVCGSVVPCDQCVDVDPKNAQCDVCGKEVPCVKCVDENRNAKCDVCGKPVDCEECEDDDDDEICDVCGKRMPCAECVDDIKDGICDECGNKMPVYAEIVLIDEKIPQFQFVLASDLSATMRKVVEQTIIKGVERKSGIVIPSVSEGNSNDEEMVYEVLVGNVTTRGEEYEYDRYSLGKKGYIIKIVGTKILINAGSDATLEDALMEFAEDFLTYEDKYLEYAVMSEKQNIEKIQSGYKVTSLAVDGNDMKGYTIAADLTIPYYKTAAEALQDTIYDRTGYWFKIVPIENADESSIVMRHIPKVYGEESFKVYSDGKTLRIDCAFDNKLSDAATTFVLNNITNATGDVNLSGTIYTQDISVVYYEDFDAKGDGKTDDFVAIYLAHQFANECGQTVMATPKKEYYINQTYVKLDGEMSPSTKQITIKTNTIWTDARFIIDDRNIDGRDKLNGGNAMYGKSIFSVESDYATTKINDLDTLAALGPIGYSYNTTKLDLGLGYPAMVVIYNNNHKVYRRSGSSYVNETNGTGQSGAQHELLLLDAEGNIDESTPFMFDYSTLTQIVVYRTDMERITVTGGTITTRACRIDASITDANGKVSELGYYARGITVSRPYTTVEGVLHFVTDEFTPEEHAQQGLEGTHYRGFFYGQETTDVTFLNCQVQGRRYFGIAGTYDLGGNLVNNLNFEGCTQVNFWVDAEGKPSDSSSGELSMRWNDINGKNVRNCWGVGGTNYCKNMNYINSQLSRFDAHCGLYNGSVIGCELTFFAITGKGDFIVKDTKWYSAGTGATDNSLIYMRGDYGSTWEGRVVLENVDAYISDSAFYVFYHGYSNWDYGYKCYIPNIDISNINIYNVKTKAPINDLAMNFFYGGKDDYMHLDTTYNTSPKVVALNEATGLYEIIVDTSGQYSLDRPSDKYYLDESLPINRYRNHNPIGMPDYIKITNISKNYTFKFVASGDPNFYFAKTKFIYGEGADDYYLGTYHNSDNHIIFG